jgi:predicted MPP superfamily phosphohydrolase
MARVPGCPVVKTLLARWLVAVDALPLLLGVGLGLSGRPRGWFLALLVPIAIAPFTWARWRLHQALAPALGRRVLAVTVVAGILLDGILLAQLLTARFPDQVPWLHGDGIAWIGPVWFSAHAIWLLVLAIGGLAGALRRIVARLAPAGDDAPPPSPERRRFLQQATAAATVIPFAAAASGVPLSYDFRVEERELVLPHWPRALDGLRVAHLSDIHVGGAMTRERLLRVAELTNASHPDLVLHTGDFLTHAHGDFDRPLYDALARMRAPLGQWACLGNHDYDDPDAFVRRLRDAGVVTLRDQRTTLTVDGQPLELAGLEFAWGLRDRRAAYAPIFDRWGARDGVPRLLLNHDPSGFVSLPDAAADLVLSGHTHGGHVGVQLGRSRALTVIGLVGLPDQGLFARGDMRLFVTRCVGFYGYPMRVGIPPEIAVLTLRTRGTARDPEPVRAL